jgi:hypothetical protein
LKQMITHFVFGNQSSLSVLLASLYLPAIVLVADYWKKFQFICKTLFIVSLFVCIYFLLATGGRAGWIGFIAGLRFLYGRDFRGSKLFTRIIWFLAVLILLVVVIYVKQDSSQGRLLIYKVSATIFKDHWLWGIGPGKFKAVYNLYQAKYFASHSIDSKEALLADNTFYAFNDTWQLLIEIGLVRFAGLAMLILLFRQYLRHLIDRKKMSSFKNGALAGMLCIIAASLFSYPFHVFAIQILFLIYLAVLLFSVGKGTFIGRRKLVHRIFQFAFLSMVLVFGFYGINKMMFINKSGQAFELYRAGFKNEALNMYASLHQSLVTNGASDFSFAKQLYNSNRLNEAKKIIAIVKQRYVDNEVYKLSAAIALETGQFERAEKDYLTALYMVPNRMRSRYDLMNFYLIAKDTAKAVYWGKSLLKMPVKVPSGTTKNLQKETKNILLTLRKR